jgi:hypothetical protein
MKAEAERHEVKAKIKPSLPCHEGIWGELRYSSTILDLYTRRRCVWSASRPGKGPIVPHWAGEWVGPRGGLALRRRENLSPTGNGIPEVQPAVIPTELLKN